MNEKAHSILWRGRLWISFFTPRHAYLLTCVFIDYANKQRIGYKESREKEISMAYSLHSQAFSYITVLSILAKDLTQNKNQSSPVCVVVLLLEMSI